MKNARFRRMRGPAAGRGETARKPPRRNPPAPPEATAIGRDDTTKACPIIAGDRSEVNKKSWIY
jgi:hypothetical protein